MPRKVTSILPIFHTIIPQVHVEGLGSFQGGLLKVAGKSFRSKVALSCCRLEINKESVLCHHLLYTRKRAMINLQNVHDYKF